MKRKLITTPTLEPVSISEVADHVTLDLDVSTADNDLLQAMAFAARERVEDVTSRALLTQTWECYLDEWPSENFITLPLGNLQSVTSVKYKDSAGTETTMTVTTQYIVETNGEEKGRIVLPYGCSWPSFTAYPSNPITIRFVCGWTSAALVPHKIKAAIKMMCADMWEMRGEPVIGQTVIENKTVDALLQSSRLWW